MSQTNISDGTRYKQALSKPIYDDSDGARFQRVPNASINMFMFGTRYKRAPSKPIYDDSDHARFQRVPNASINMFMFGTRYKRVPFWEPYEKIFVYLYPASITQRLRYVINHGK